MGTHALEPLADGLWVASRPLPLWVGDVGTRMTVVRLSGGELWLHSPVALDDATCAALDALGPVRWVVGPNKVHHLFLGDYARAYPSAELCAAPGLPAKRRDLAFHHVLDGGWAPPWRSELPHLLFEGAARLNEIVFFHPATRTLILTDLAFHVVPPTPNRARILHWLLGATGRFGPHRLVRSMIRDRAAARGSVEKILGWDFDRVIVTHGSVLATGGRQRFREGFAYLGLGSESGVSSRP